MNSMSPYEIPNTPLSPMTRVTLSTKDINKFHPSNGQFIDSFQLYILLFLTIYGSSKGTDNHVSVTTSSHFKKLISSHDLTVLLYQPSHFRTEPSSH